MRRSTALCALLITTSGLARAEAPPPAAPEIVLVRLDPVEGCENPANQATVRCLTGTAFPPGAGALDDELDLRLEGRRASLAGDLWARLLDDLTLSWGDKRSVTAGSLGKVLKATTMPSDTFDTGPTVPGRGRWMKIHSVPASPVLWVDLAGAEARFTRVEWRLPSAARPPRTVVLSGRFATRMAAGGAPVSAQLLGADTPSGQAFYEQMFPVSAEAERAGYPVAAFGAFQRPPSEGSPWWDCATGKVGAPPGVDPGVALPIQIQLAGATLGCVEGLASQHARRFFDQLGEVVLRFGLPGTLPAQLRVLTASTGLIAPPGRYPALAPVMLDDLVVASQGQLDPASMRAVPPPPAGPPGQLSLDWAKLPETVVWEALRARAASETQEARALETLNARLTALFAPPTGKDAAEVAAATAKRAAVIKADPIGAQVKDPPAALTALTRAAFQDWATANAQPGRQTSVFDTLGWWALGLMVGAEPTTAQLASARALLLDQLHYQIYSTLDPTRAVAPKEQVGAAEKIWATALGDHGVNVQGLPQAGPLMVDPTAVCTTGDGAEALGEKVTQQVHLDLYFIAPPGSASPQDALWAQRALLPWVAVDDPARNRPQVEAVDLSLPGGGALYRARWQVWTGWHLLWRTEHAPAGVALAPAFGAICSDLALVHQDLLPGLVRAALRGEATDEVSAAVLGPLRALAPEGGGAVVALADIQREKRWLFPIRLLPRQPLARRQARSVKGADPGWLLAEGRALLLSANPKADDLALAPDLVPTPTPPPPPPEMPAALAAEIAEKTKPRYRSAVRTDQWTDAGLGVLLGSPAASGVGPSLDLRLGAQSWLSSAPRLGWTVGAGAQILGWPAVDATRTSSPFPGLELPAASGLVFVGLRLAPLPPMERAARAGVAWGDTAASGKREVGRTQTGLLFAFAAGNGQNDVSLRSGWLEPWVAWSLHPNGVPREGLQPYAPGLMLGLYARVGGEATTDTAACTATLGSSRCLWGGAGVRVFSLGERGKKP